MFITSKFSPAKNVILCPEHKCVTTFISECRMKPTGSQI